MSKQINDAKKVLERMTSEKNLNKKETLNLAKTDAECITKAEDEEYKTLRRGTKLLDDAFILFDEAFVKMNRREIEVVERTKKHVSTLKDMANRVSEGIARIEKITGPDFESKLKRLEQFADAIEKLNKLNKTGELNALVNALTPTTELTMSKAQFLAERQRPGEIYAGLILGKNGQPDYHLFLLPQKPITPKNDWDSSMSWAASVGGVLPTPPEQSLLHANCKEHFEKDWYWSSEQDAHDDSYAWMQVFDYGNQYGDRKSSGSRARAVRRELIIE